MLPKDMAGCQPIFYVQFEYNNLQHRLAQFGVNTTGADGDIAFVDGLIDFTYAEKAGNFGGDLEANIVTIFCAIPNTNVAALHNRGVQLDGVACEFGYLLWRDGNITHTYEKRTILYKGQITAPEFGDPSQPNNFTSFTIDARPFTNRQLLLDPSLVIDNRFADRHIPTADGKQWPLVFGQPTSTPAYAIQKYNMTDAKFMVAGHLVANMGTTPTVIITDDNGQSVTKIVYDAIDIYGNPYSYISVTSADGIALPGALSTAPQSNEWWIEWLAPAHINLFGGYQDYLGRGGDLVLWALLRSGAAIDFGAWANVGALLNAYSFDGFINDATIYAWEWVQGNIMQLLPVGVHIGADGVRPVFNLLDAIKDIAPVARWYVANDGDTIQDGPITTNTDPTDIVNDVTVKYAYDIATNDFASRYRVAHNSKTATPNEYAQISYNRYGNKQLTIEATYLYNAPTAGLIAQNMVQAQSQPTYTITIIAAVQWGYIAVGDIIEVTAPDVGLTNHKCMVVSKEWAGIQWQFELRYNTNPIQRIQ